MPYFSQKSTKGAAKLRINFESTIGHQRKDCDFREKMFKKGVFCVNFYKKFQRGGFDGDNNLRWYLFIFCNNYIFISP